MLPPRPPDRVPDAPARFPPDYAGLADVLGALAYGARLELLDMLRFPHTAGEIRLNPHRHAAGANPDRAISKQAVQAHLDKLVDVGLVRVEQVTVEGRATNRYAANVQQLYSLVEDLRGLCVRYAGRGPVGSATGTLAAPAQPVEARGPRLTLVHGVYEGKAFPLTDETARDGRWVIGRQRLAPISLDYDPFVSGEHAFVSRVDGGFSVTDAPRSKNGTMLNWTPLPRGGTAALRPGDVVSVGRSHLVFAPA